MEKDSSPFARGFAPVAAHDARILILGSLPGRKSIEMQQYYAQPQNTFWRIMGDLCGASPQLHYEARLEQLKAAGIALWDVLAAGQRRGSLDSAIVASTIVVNDFSFFFEVHREITMVCFNGRKAADLYRRWVRPALPKDRAPEEYDLPSTSPAHAGKTFEQKREVWSQAIQDPLHSGGPAPISRTRQ